MATPTGGKTPIMPALEALLQQTANVAANVSQRDAKREFFFFCCCCCLSVRRSRAFRDSETRMADPVPHNTRAT